jgi:predicted outer membrane protein
LKEYFMSAPENVSRRIVAIAVACLVAAPAIAQQQTQNPGEIKPSQYRDDVAERDSNSGSASQTDRASDQQRDQSSIQLNSQSSERSSTSQPYTANFRGSQRSAGSSQQVDQFLAACLLAKNKAEIELSQLAAQQSDNEQVKQFAQQMVEDHQKMTQQLQQIAGSDAAGASSTGTTSASERTSSTSLGTGSATRSNNESNSTNLSSDASERSQSSATTDASRRGEASGAGQSQSSADLPGSSGAGRSAATGQATGSSTSRTATSTSTAGAPGSASDSGVIHRLTSIDRQIVEQQAEATRQELQQKQGAEFDKAFVGTAINAHVHMNAALEVIGQQSQGQLAQVAQQAQPVVQQHLEHAKQLMEQLKEGGRTNQAERSSSRTQR